MSSVQQCYDELIGELRTTALLKSCAVLLGWDEQTYLPPGGAEHRANQLSLLAGMVHERSTSPRLGELLAELESIGALADGDSLMAVNVRETRRVYDRVTKLPRKLVEELSHVTILAQQVWVEARKKADFPLFLPWLEKIVRLKREEAEAVGYAGGVPYDALLADYEPHATTTAVEATFKPLRDELVPLAADIQQSSKRPDVSILKRRYPIDVQRQLAVQAAERIGFRFDEGRLDVAPHPFCSEIGPGDCRLTTRYDEQYFSGGFFGVLHEAGHGMYDQGLDHSAFGTPMGSAVSMGIHESQSLLWETFVGRSRPFWTGFYPAAQQAFPEALGDVPLDDFYAAVNDVRPSFIRVDADEVTYSLHVMLRFELEPPLITGDLKPADVPGVWNETFRRYLGLTPPDDAQGCLQDIHWSAGLIGYFPTYVLGKMYAAQFFATARQALGDLDAQIVRGEFRPLKEWLNEHIHRRGQQYPAHRLVEVVTGRPPSPEPLLEYLHTKYDELYGL